MPETIVFKSPCHVFDCSPPDVARVTLRHPNMSIKVCMEWWNRDHWQEGGRIQDFWFTHPLELAELAELSKFPGFA
jgi:hypothetical protein